MSFEEKLLKFESDKKDFEEKINCLKEEAKTYGYEYDEKTNSFNKIGTTVHVLDIYVTAKTLYESSGFYRAYASMILIPDVIFNKVKDLLGQKSKDNWLELIELMNEYDDSILNDFYKCLDYSEIENLEDYVQVSFYNNSDTSYSEREGVLKFYEELFFSVDGVDGYLSFFDMDRDSYLKNKHTEYFFNEKYLRDNAPFEYYGKNFYVK